MCGTDAAAHVIAKGGGGFCLQCAKAVSISSNQRAAHVEPQLEVLCCDEEVLGKPEQSGTGMVLDGDHMCKVCSRCLHVAVQTML